MIRFTSSSQTVSLLPFFDTPQLERITRLDISGVQLSPVELEPLAECHHLANLTDLCLRKAPVLPDWLEMLLMGGSLPALTGLELADLTHLGPRLADVLPSIDHRRFVRLDLSGIAFNSNQVKSVLDSACVRDSVEELRLGWMAGAGRQGAVAHINPGWAFPWSRLRLLDLGGQKIGDDGVIEIVKAIVRRPSEAPLRWLGLANNEIGSEGVRALLNAPDAKLRLHHLDVRNNGLSIAQLAAFQSRFPTAVIEG